MFLALTKETTFRAGLLPLATAGFTDVRVVSTLFDNFSSYLMARHTTTSAISRIYAHESISNSDDLTQ